MPSLFQRFLRGSIRRRAAASTPEEEAFKALVGKFSQIQYLVNQKATLDVIEKTPVGICITNKQYHYEYVNPAYCQIYGYEYDELIGNSFTMVVPEEYRQELMDLHDRFMDQEAELEGEWKVVNKQGQLRTILANAAYVVDEEGRGKKITFVLDITLRREATEKLEQEQQRHEAMVTALKTGILPEVDRLTSSGNGGDLKELRQMIRDLVDE